MTSEQIDTLLIPVLIWLLFAIIVAYIADKKGRSAIGFFLLSLFFSPVIGLIAALLSGGQSKTSELERLATLKDKGTLTEAEFQKAKAKILLLLSLAFLIGCGGYALPTRSGKPEIMVGVSKKVLVGALVNSLVSDGYIIEQQTENIVSGSKTENDFWAGQLRRVKQYAITDEGDSIRVILYHLVNGGHVSVRRFIEEDQAVLNTFKRGLPQ